MLMIARIKIEMIEFLSVNYGHRKIRYFVFVILWNKLVLTNTRLLSIIKIIYNYLLYQTVNTVGTI